MMSESTRKTAESILLPLLTGVLGFVASPFLRETWDFSANELLPKLSKQGQLSLLATLTILCLVLAAWVYTLISKRFLIRRFKRSAAWYGAYENKKDENELVCGICLNKNVISPLIFDKTQKGLACGSCKLAISRV